MILLNKTTPDQNKPIEICKTKTQTNDDERT